MVDYFHYIDFKIILVVSKYFYKLFTELKYKKRVDQTIL